MVEGNCIIVASFHVTAWSLDETDNWHQLVLSYLLTKYVFVVKSDYSMKSGAFDIWFQCSFYLVFCLVCLNVFSTSLTSTEHFQVQSRLDFSLFREGDCTIFMCLLMRKYVLKAESVEKNGVETP